MPIFQTTPPVQRLMPLSIGIETAIIERLRTAEQLTDDFLIDMVEQGFMLVHPAETVKRHREALVDRVLGRIQAINADKAESKSIASYGKTLGTQFTEWLGDLNSEHLCVYLANYDLEYAYHLYWHTDVEWVQEALKLRGQHDSQKAILDMEACLYGFGGKYQDDAGAGGGKVNNHDLNNEESIAALRSLGF